MRCLCEVQPGFCHSLKTGSLQSSVNERLEPAHHSEVLTSACQWEGQHIDCVCVGVKQQKVTNRSHDRFG